MCGKSATTTTQSAPNPQAMAAYQQLLGQAGSVSQLPFQQYGGEFVAPLNAQQQTAGANINANAGFAMPYIQQGAQYATQAAQPVTAAQIAGFQSPYTQQVVNATEAQFQNQNQQQLENVRGNAAAQGALGGDREAIAEAITSGQQSLAQSPTIAGLYNQGYNTALSTALQEQQQLGQSAYSLGNLGVAGQNAALSGANAQLGYGTLGQSTQQAYDQALYNQFLAQQAYPFQTTQWLAGIDTAAGSQMGGTSSTTGPQPNQAGQYAGLALAAMALLNRGGSVEGRDRGGRIPGFQLGGTPYSGLGSGSSYIPSINLTMGQGAPKPPGSSGQSQSQIDPFKLASSTMDLEKKISGLGGGSTSFGGIDYGDSDMASAAQAGVESGLSFDPMTGDVFARGGGIHDDDRPSAFRQEIERRRDLSDAYIPHPAKLQDRFISGVRGSSADMPLWDSEYCGGGKVRGFAGGGLADDLGIDDIGSSFDDRFANSGVDPAADTERRVANLAGLVNPGDSPGRGLGLGDIVQSAAPGFDYNNGFGVDDSRASHSEAMRQSGDRYQAAAAAAPPADYVNPSSVNGQAQNLTGPEIPPGGTGGAPEAPARGLDVSAYAPVPGTAGAPAIPSPQQEEKKAEKTAGFGILDKLGIHLDPNTRKAMLAAGFGMMASRSPFLGNAIGEGGLAGLSAYNAGEKQQLSVEESRKKLEAHAKEVADKLALETKKEQHNQEYRQQHLDYLKQHAKELLEQGKFSAPVSGMGQNERGEQVPGSYVTNAKTGEPKFYPGVVLTGKGASAPLPAEAWNTHGEDFLKYLPADKREFTKKLSNYEIDPKTLSVTGGHREESLGWASQYDPNFDQKTYNARYNAVNRFSTGPQGQNITSLNTTMYHLDTLGKAVDALNNGNVQLFNRAANFMAGQFGYPSVTNFEGVRNIAADEVVKSVLGTAGSDADREGMRHSILAAGSPAQLKGVIEQYEDMMAGRLHALRFNFKDATGLDDAHFDRKLTPQTRERLGRLEAGVGHGSAGAPAAGGVPRVNSLEEARRLPRGTRFLDPNGHERIVP